MNNTEIKKILTQTQDRDSLLSEFFKTIFEKKSLVEYFPGIKLGGLGYNHTKKLYCNIDLYNEDCIIDVVLEDVKITYELYLISMIKLLITNKKIANIYNLTNGRLLILNGNENNMKIIDTLL